MRIQIFHVHHSYLPDIPSLSDISLTFEPGDFCFLIGSSGAGKSTLFKIMFAQEQPQSGQVLVGDWPVHQLTHRDRPYYRRLVGYVFQDLKLLSRRTASENIALPLQAMGTNRKIQRHRVHDLLHRVGLGHMARSRIDQLSGSGVQ